MWLVLQPSTAFQSMLGLQLAFALGWLGRVYELRRQELGKYGRNVSVWPCTKCRCPVLKLSFTGVKADRRTTVRLADSGAICIAGDLG